MSGSSQYNKLLILGALITILLSTLTLGAEVCESNGERWWLCTTTHPDAVCGGKYGDCDRQTCFRTGTSSQNLGEHTNPDICFVSWCADDFDWSRGTGTDIQDNREGCIDFKWDHFTPEDIATIDETDVQGLATNEAILTLFADADGSTLKEILLAHTSFDQPLLTAFPQNVFQHLSGLTNGADMSTLVFELASRELGVTLAADLISCANPEAVCMFEYTAGTPPGITMTLGGAAVNMGTLEGASIIYGLEGYSVDGLFSSLEVPVFSGGPDSAITLTCNGQEVTGTFDTADTSLLACAGTEGNAVLHLTQGTGATIDIGGVDAQFTADDLLSLYFGTPGEEGVYVTAEGTLEIIGTPEAFDLMYNCGLYTWNPETAEVSPKSPEDGDIPEGCTAQDKQLDIFHDGNQFSFNNKCFVNVNLNYCHNFADNQAYSLSECQCDLEGVPGIAGSIGASECGMIVGVPSEYDRTTAQLTETCGYCAGGFETICQRKLKGRDPNSLSQEEKDSIVAHIKENVDRCDAGEPVGCGVTAGSCSEIYPAGHPALSNSAMSAMCTYCDGGYSSLCERISSHVPEGSTTEYLKSKIQPFVDKCSSGRTTACKVGEVPPPPGGGTPPPGGGPPAPPPGTFECSLDNPIDSCETGELCECTQRVCVSTSTGTPTGGLIGAAGAGNWQKLCDIPSGRPAKAFGEALSFNGNFYIGLKDVTGEDSENRNAPEEGAQVWRLNPQGSCFIKEAELDDSSAGEAIGPFVAFNNKLYAGTEDHSGIFRQNSPGSWSVVHRPGRPQVSFSAGGAVLGNTLYFGTSTDEDDNNPAYIYQTTDGTNWNRAYSGSGEGFFNAITYNNQIYMLGYLGDKDQAAYATWNGNSLSSWKRLDGDYAWTAAEAGGDLYIGTRHPGNIYQITPSGSATKVFSGGLSVHRITALGDTLFAGVDKDVYRSDDGRTWQKTQSFPGLVKTLGTHNGKVYAIISIDEGRGYVQAWVWEPQATTNTLTGNAIRSITGNAFADITGMSHVTLPSEDCIAFSRNGNSYCDDDADYERLLRNGGQYTFHIQNDAGGTFFIAYHDEMGIEDGKRRCQGLEPPFNPPPFTVIQDFTAADDGKTFTIPASDELYTLGVYGPSGQNEAYLCPEGTTNNPPPEENPTGAKAQNCEIDADCGEGYSCECIGTTCVPQGGATCGNNVCDEGENSTSCPQDCSTLSEETCTPGKKEQCFTTPENYTCFMQRTCTPQGTWGECTVADQTCTESCTDATLKACPRQYGVCAGSTQTCTNEAWPGCDYTTITGYENNETSCDNLDNDCDGVIDEGCLCGVGSNRACGTDIGACTTGTQACSQGTYENTCTGGTKPQQEICANGIDDDCDGSIDEECPCGQTYGEGFNRTCGQNACGSGIQYCQDQGGTLRFTACIGATIPQLEVCGDNLDNDCDGSVDEGCGCVEDRTCGSTDVGVCQQGVQTCGDNNLYGTCTGAVYPETEICGDDLDNDCDGSVDEGCPCETGDTKQCSNQGVCSGTIVTCVNGTFPSCNYANITTYESAETTCDDQFDNDCDGTTDLNDLDCKGDSSITCSDGTPNNQCSTSKPNYCDGGSLIQKCSTCLCPQGLRCDITGKCVEEYTPPTTGTNNPPSGTSCNFNDVCDIGETTSCADCSTGPITPPEEESTLTTILLGIVLILIGGGLFAITMRKKKGGSDLARQQKR